MNIHPRITADAVVDAVARDDNTGFCIACANEQGGAEPDAENYECEACGERKVYGAEQLLIMGAGS